MAWVETRTFFAHTPTQKKEKKYFNSNPHKISKTSDCMKIRVSISSCWDDAKCSEKCEQNTIQMLVRISIYVYMSTEYRPKTLNVRSQPHTGIVCMKHTHNTATVAAAERL